MTLCTFADLIARRPSLKEMVAVAVRIRERAYAPNTGIRVGALIAVDNSVGWPHSARLWFPGCNIENAVELATHAEQAAIAMMIGKIGCDPKPVIATVVVALVPRLDSKPALPCGFCLQWIAEFGTPATEIFGVRLGQDGQEVMGVECTTLGAELPHAFST